MSNNNQAQQVNLPIPVMWHEVATKVVAEIMADRAVIASITATDVSDEESMVRLSDRLNMISGAAAAVADNHLNQFAERFIKRQEPPRIVRPGPGAPPPNLRMPEA